MTLGLICNILSTPMDNTPLGRLLATRSPGIFTTSTEVMLSSTFHQAPSEGNSKITTSLLPRLSGTGMPKMERSVGTPVALPSLMLTTLSVNTSQELTVSSEANAKREKSQSKKDGLWLKFKRYLLINSGSKNCHFKKQQNRRNQRKILRQFLLIDALHLPLSPCRSWSCRFDWIVERQPQNSPTCQVQQHFRFGRCYKRTNHQDFLRRCLATSRC